MRINELRFRVGLFVSVAALEKSIPEEYEPVGSDQEKSEYDPVAFIRVEFDVDKSDPEESGSEESDLREYEPDKYLPLGEQHILSGTTRNIFLREGIGGAVLPPVYESAVPAVQAFPSESGMSTAEGRVVIIARSPPPRHYCVYPRKERPISSKGTRRDPQHAAKRCRSPLSSRSCHS